MSPNNNALTNLQSPHEKRSNQEIILPIMKNVSFNSKKTRN
jgi:hypothetical protein